MKVLSYNIFEGGHDPNKPEARWKYIIKVVKKADPDVLIILEANNWQQQRLKKFAKKVNMPFYRLSKSNTKYHLAIFSKVKPKKITLIKKGYHHSVIKAKINDLTIYGVHLNPDNENKRLLEAKRLIKDIKNEKSALIIGDFNSLSPLDQYNKKVLIKLLAKLKIKKFGVNKIDTRVMSYFLRHGLIDVFSKSDKNFTVPTKMNRDKFHATKLRLDYALANKPLASSITQKVIYSQGAQNASDHFPLLIKIKRETS